MDKYHNPGLKKANIKTALTLGAIALGSLIIASYGISQTLAMS